MSSIETLSSQQCFGGEVRFCRHASSSTRTDMEFSVFVPPAAANGPVPVVYWLSGLTCTAENFTAKAGAQRFAAEHGLLLVAPDTSPRGAGVAGEDKTYDLGTGAGFYLNATVAKWAANYRMYDYVVEELPELIRSAFPARADRESIFGHSMGGHGALVCALRNPGRYRSVSAFAPIVAPTACPWGERAFTEYLGPDRTTWEAWDAHLLVRGASERLPLLIDQGEADGFLTDQLMPERMEEACRAVDHPIEVRRRPGYDHSYYFIASFVGEHLAHHARALAD
ncbi:MAG: S-formylglutathione hydrolase [Candidatus Binatia bacterium]|nr:S-formylglutathione hydrolase [Candidatus Binatia bacterium]